MEANYKDSKNFYPKNILQLLRYNSIIARSSLIVEIFVLL